MFQYAAGRCLAEKRNTSVKTDFIRNRGDIARDYSLSCYSLTENIANKKDIGFFRYFVSRTKAGKLFGRLYKLLPISGRKYIKEPYFHFYLDFFQAPDDAYLDGYWQSEKYSKDIESVIRREFSLKSECAEKLDKELLGIINSSNSISLHVRRSDYVADNETSRVHGACSAEYYKKAFEYIAKSVSSPHIFIFSDDIEWAKDNLKFDCPVTYVSNGKYADYEEMYYMSRCKHNIIANSSFSWWGSWLNQNPERIVVAPKNWFNDKRFNTKDLIPDSWIKI